MKFQVCQGDCQFRLRKRQLPAFDWDVNKGDDQCAVDEVTFAVVLDPPKDLLVKFPNLKAIQSTAAGVDHLVDKEIPKNIPILRVVDDVMCQRMATWMVWAVTNIHRKMDQFYSDQQSKIWNRVLGNEVKDNCDVTIGIMGLGAMGGTTAKFLLQMGYKVIGWTRSPRNDEEEGLQCFNGSQNLFKFVGMCDILICLLPLTHETRNIINKELLYALPKGASIINGGRGQHLVEQDLVEALNDGQISHAILDVFQSEPLPSESPLWYHPKVRITPHVSSLTPQHSAIEQIISNYQRILQNQNPDPKYLVDLSRGY
eukprot:TRINITY_DN1117_c0_g1_i17.p1 TRINITY_DN1117_c0_g1~~TRINITY_DN1117_c0_g1_i17.p1  ORF type:complete len:314 (+),score=34.61 TRINITY_DN1117_c0_g1_i17:48-989(+)